MRKKFVANEAVCRTSGIGKSATHSRQYPPFWRILVFVILALDYAFWSSSTPDEFGVPEAIIGAMLLLFVGLRGAIVALGGFLSPHSFGLSKWAFVSFIGLLLIPLIWGVFVRQNSLNDIVRDVIPLCYFFLPVFFIPHMSKHPEFWKKMCEWSLCVIGVAYSMRWFLDVQDGVSEFGRQTMYADSSNTFQQDPSVIFSGTFLLVFGILSIFKKLNLFAMICFVLGFVAYASLIGSNLRAQIVLVLFSIILAILLYVKNIQKTFHLLFWLTAIFVAVIGGLSMTEITSQIYDLIARKTEAAGFLNSRDLEASAVFSNASSSLSLVMQGEGWGGVIDNPAAGYVVRFTHVMLYYFLFKGGVIASLFALIYLGLIVLKLAECFTLEASFSSAEGYAVIFGVVNVLMVNIFIEAGYKTFTFGLVLTLLWLQALVKKRSTVILL